MIVVISSNISSCVFKNQIREYFTNDVNDKYNNIVIIRWNRCTLVEKKCLQILIQEIKLTDSMLGVLKIDDIDIQNNIQDVTEDNLINGVA